MAFATLRCCIVWISNFKQGAKKMAIRKLIEDIAIKLGGLGSRFEWTLGYTRHCRAGTPWTTDGVRLIVFDIAGRNVAVVDGETLPELLPAILERLRRKLIERRQRKRRA
jgi:hypothetical protein